MRTASSCLALLASGSFVACDQTTLTDTDVPSLSFQIVSGNLQSGPVGQELPNPLVVRAVDGLGKPVKKELVNFVVTAGGGSMFAGASITDNDGLAQDYLTLGPEPVVNVVEVRAVNPTTGEKYTYATFTALPLFAAFLDEASFLSASGAIATVTYPSVRGLTAVPYVENGVTLVQAAGFNNRVDDFTPIFLGNEFAVSGAENINVTFDVNPYSFGLWMQDGWEVGFINWSPPQDSQFEFTFYGPLSEILGFEAVDPPRDEAFFLGVVSAATPIARVEIREVNSSINELFEPYVENDFFSTIYTSTSLPGG